MIILPCPCFIQHCHWILVDVDCVLEFPFVKFLTSYFLLLLIFVCFLLLILLILISSFLCSIFAMLRADCRRKTVNVDRRFSSGFSNVLILLSRDFIVEFWSLILASFIWIWPLWSVLADISNFPSVFHCLSWSNFYT